MGWARWAKSRGPPSSRDKATKRRRGKERVECGRGPWRAVLAFLPMGPRVPSYATAGDMAVRRGIIKLGQLESSYHDFLAHEVYRKRGKDQGYRPMLVLLATPLCRRLLLIESFAARGVVCGVACAVSLSLAMRTRRPPTATVTISR